jgi:lysozyme
MKMTVEGLDLIKEHEGFRTRAYRDATGILTIGYGHTAMAGPPHVRPGLEISRLEAENILRRDVERFAEGVRRALRRELSDRQFSALVSFSYNIGLTNFQRSSVLRAVNAGDFEAVPRRLSLWVKAGGRTLPGLIKRRAAEAALFAGETREPTDTAGKPQIEPPRGKPTGRSTTTLAAIVSALAAAASSLASGVRDLAGALPTVHPSLIAALIVAVAAAWIIRERWLKSRDEGI